MTHSEWGLFKAREFFKVTMNNIEGFFFPDTFTLALFMEKVKALASRNADAMSKIILALMHQIITASGIVNRDYYKNI